MSLIDLPGIDLPGMDPPSRCNLFLRTVVELRLDELLSYEAMPSSHGTHFGSW